MIPRGAETDSDARPGRTRAQEAIPRCSTWVSALALALALLLIWVGAPARASDPAGVEAARVNGCGDLVFTPQSGDKYVQIRTSRLRCRTARQLLRRYRYDGPYSNKGPRGWRCKFRASRAVGAGHGAPGGRRE